jgi:hypothetical protein
MDNKEVARLRKAICRSFGSSPHKKKVWLALLEMCAGERTMGHRAKGCAGKLPAICERAKSGGAGLMSPRGKTRDP